jgi:hypothetical protein
MPTDNDEAVPDSASCPSDDARDDQNATDEEAIPSQYKKSRHDDDDDAEKANESEGSSDECIDQEAIDRDAALRIDCEKFIRRFEHMAGQLKAIMHVQKEDKATKRKRGAEMPAPEPKRLAPFTPPRKAPISVKATQLHHDGSEREESDLEEYADDDDSVLSQSSSKAPRKKLQPNWRFLGVKQIQTWLAETAAVEMAKAGPIEDIPPGKNEIGGFRRAHVSEIILFPVPHKSHKFHVPTVQAGPLGSRPGPGRIRSRAHSQERPRATCLTRTHLVEPHGARLPLTPWPRAQRRRALSIRK